MTADSAPGVSWLQYHDPPVRLHAGGTSHWLIDCAELWADGDLRDVIVAHLRHKLDALYPGPASLVAIPRGGICWAQAIARAGDEVYSIEGWQAAPLGSLPAVLVDDVYTTGASIAAARVQFGPVPALVVVNRASFNPLWDVWAWAYIPLP